ncbi:PEP/pyruvate-binding domain-containing protein [Vibrio quintilis]|uniref:Phosphoenolpyruvate synthase n=1 Tax=Vibrio quintilis TaxID=1117707 RepID=A0A1M7YYA0_9VIBR|nr:PEP/pyruvate-binding domain-containing protein [Vibrio quintilis]SHO57533.1 Phosphoenolpyruvate synthase [Vibrio quintilis]
MSHAITDFTMVVGQTSEIPGETENYAGLLRRILGGKGASLWELSNKMKMPVPAFCCITACAFTETLRYNQLDSLVQWLMHPDQPLPASEARIRDLIMACRIPKGIAADLTTFTGRYPEERFAVRSSGTVEDGAETSFAGLFESVLNVQKTEDILQAVKTCWCSLFNERVQTYMTRQHTAVPLGMAVVIQQLIPAEKSGVMFTVDPVHGADTEMLIEATFGLGEALVSGAVTPDQYRYDWYQEQESDRTIAEKEHQCVRINEAPFVRMEPLPAAIASHAVLTTTEVRELADLGLQIQMQSGFPVDIEWACTGNQFYILQSRPITQFGYTSINGEWTSADYRDGGVSSTVCTPYMASLYKYALDGTMGAYLERLKLSPARGSVWQKSFFGRPYWNLSEVKKCLAKIPGFNERVFDQGLGISPRYQGDGIVSKTNLKTLLTGIRALLIIRANVKRKLKTTPSFSLGQHRRLQELAAMNFSTLPDDELFQFYQSFICKEFFVNESTYFDLIYDNTNLNGLFKDEVEKTRFDMSQFPLLISGLSGVSHMAPMERLWKMRDLIHADQDCSYYWLNSSSEQIATDLQHGETHYHLNSLRVYLREYGHHSQRELDMLVPRYAEVPEMVIEQLQDVLRQGSEKDPRVRNNEQQIRMNTVKRELLHATPLLKRRKMSQRLEQVREFLWWREELRDLSIRYYLYVRKITLAVEARLLKNGILAQKDDAFFLDMPDLVAVVRGDIPPDEARHLVRKNRAYYLSFAHYQIADEVGERYGMFGGSQLSTPQSEVQPADGQTVTGVSGSPGMITGVARVISDIHDADRLQPDDILVTRCTDPGWTPKFSMLKGVVTETGGILSHAAVICREYGIPAVLAVKHATRIIQDGDIITIDGSRGHVIPPVREAQLHPEDLADSSGHGLSADQAPVTASATKEATV